jgi:hypothetical protein
LYFQVLEILHFVQDDKKTTLAGASVASQIQGELAGKIITWGPP